MSRVCLSCWGTSRKRSPCVCGGRIGPARAVANKSRDSELLDFLERFSERGGYWTGMTISDSRDMGYTSKFVTLEMEGVEGKGNSLREALVDLMGKAGKV